MGWTRGQARKRKLRERAMAGVRAREEKRLAEAACGECVGTVRFEGPMFGGEHVIRCLDHDDPEGHVWLEIDGNLHKPRTVRGVRAVLARRLRKPVNRHE